MEKGTLVRVKDQEMPRGDQRAVEYHGRLWVYQQVTNPSAHSIADVMRDYKSLADGSEFCWFDSQVEVS